jgi:hypothetical protein
VQALTIDAKRALLREYLSETENGQNRPYNPATAEFKDAIERMQFGAWMRKRLAPAVVPAELKAWIKARKG